MSIQQRKGWDLRAIGEKPSVRFGGYESREKER